MRISLSCLFLLFRGNDKKKREFDDPLSRPFVSMTGTQFFLSFFIISPATHTHTHTVQSSLYLTPPDDWKRRKKTKIKPRDLIQILNNKTLFLFLQGQASFFQHPHVVLVVFSDYYYDTLSNNLYVPVLYIHDTQNVFSLFFFVNSCYFLYFQTNQIIFLTALQLSNRPQTKQE